MKIANKIIEKILNNNAAIADLCNELDKSLSRMPIIIEENKKNGHLTTWAALKIICMHTGEEMENILVSAK